MDCYFTCFADIFLIRIFLGGLIFSLAVGSNFAVSNHSSERCCDIRKIHFLRGEGKKSMIRKI